MAGRRGGGRPPRREDAIRYVVARKNRSGDVRWYWRRPGFDLVRLPDDAVTRSIEAIKLNDMADRAREGVAKREGTMAWLVAAYRENAVRIGKAKPYGQLAKQTRANYARFLRDLEERLGHLHVSAFTRRVVVDYVAEVEQGSRAVAAAVLKNLLALAEYHGLVDDNKAAGLGIEKGPPRRQWWPQEALEEFYQACTAHREGAAVWDGIMLILYTAQRVVDAIQLGLPNVVDGWWQFSQGKTKKAMDFPVHQALAPIIAEARAAGRMHLVASSTGAAVPYGTFDAWFRDIRDQTSLQDLQLRDLRRTAATTLKEMGLDDDYIITLTGHTKASFQAMMSEVYIVKTRKMARKAVSRWERADGSAVRRVAPFKNVAQSE